MVASLGTRHVAQPFSSVPPLMSLSFGPLGLILSLMELASIRSIGLFHLNRPGMVAALTPMITGHVVSTIEAS
jgi:hypothetical protein